MLIMILSHLQLVYHVGSCDIGASRPHLQSLVSCIRVVADGAMH